MTVWTNVHIFPLSSGSECLLSSKAFGHFKFKENMFKNTIHGPAFQFKRSHLLIVTLKLPPLAVPAERPFGRKEVQCFHCHGRKRQPLRAPVEHLIAKTVMYKIQTVNIMGCLSPITTDLKWSIFSQLGVKTVDCRFDCSWTHALVLWRVLSPGSVLHRQQGCQFTVAVCCTSETVLTLDSLRSKLNPEKETVEV